MRICCLVDFAVAADNIVKIKDSEKIHKYVDLARKLKKAEEYAGDGDINCS